MSRHTNRVIGGGVLGLLAVGFFVTLCFKSAVGGLGVSALLVLVALKIYLKDNRETWKAYLVWLFRMTASLLILLPIGYVANFIAELLSWGRWSRERHDNALFAVIIILVSLKHAFNVVLLFHGNRGHALAECLRCGSPVNPGTRFCGQCGYDLDNMEGKTCPKCGEPIEEGRECCCCGKRRQNDEIGP